DLITTYQINVDGRSVRRRFAGGLLGHWAIWTQQAVRLLGECHRSMRDPGMLPELLIRNGEVTDCNAVIFDPAHGFAGCIPAILEILRRQGLVQTNLCLDPAEVLSEGQARELDRICQSYPHLVDDRFVEAHRDEWLR
ncbi:MAG: dihydrodipicolinate synthase family protein, partial [Pirellulaceae bacterium]|nr:dihydrodipicolinate synthase family protein [Pirellulaceae bacterium]